MSPGHLLLGVYQDTVLAYFVVLNLVYAFLTWLGMRALSIHVRERSEVAVRDLLAGDAYKPVSILVAAFNEERSIVASVRSFLALDYPELEVIVACDGCTDRTVERLIEAFELGDRPHIVRRTLATQPVRRVLRSTRHRNLTVIDKDNGGRADALNAALNMARHPLVCAVDADSLLDAGAVLRASRLFVEDRTLVAVGGTVRPLNGATMRDGRVAELNLPRRWVERIQVLEYARAFFAWRVGWSRLGAVLIISGAFGLFRREIVTEVGGYLAGSVGEDMELTWRLHKHLRQARLPYRILFTPDPICWTEVPSDIRTLRTQRNRWQRGLVETLWLHRDMLLRRRYGRVGMVAVPYYWLFEAMAPIVEVSGYVAMPVCWALGILDGRFAVLFGTLALLHGVLLSQTAAGIETLLLTRYSRVRDRLLLLVAAVVENLGFRQLLCVERLVATFQVSSRRGRWGRMRRQGITV